MNNKFYCGIDVSKKKLDVMLLAQEKFHYKVVENSNEGVNFLQDWIKSKLEKTLLSIFAWRQLMSITNY